VAPGGAAVQSTGARRGAMMATLRCDHPDIETFIAAKRRPGALTHFNLSVLVTDGFLRAVDADSEWPLVFPAEVAGRHMLRAVRARALWEGIVRAAYECAEPGVIFIDRVRALDNLGYAERISATNPCGEIPLPEQSRTARTSRRLGIGTTASVQVECHALAEYARLNGGAGPLPESFVTVGDIGPGAD